VFVCLPLVCHFCNIVSWHESQRTRGKDRHRVDGWAVPPGATWSPEWLSVLVPTHSNCLGKMAVKRVCSCCLDCKLNILMINHQFLGWKLSSVLTWKEYCALVFILGKVESCSFRWSLKLFQNKSLLQSSSTFRMRVVNHNWSATKQHLHPQSVAEISRHLLQWKVMNEAFKQDNCGGYGKVSKCGNAKWHEKKTDVF